MITQTIRAVYEHGVLRPLDEIKLSEGETVNISVHTELSTREAYRAALSDLLVPRTAPTVSDEELAALEETLRKLTVGAPPLSDIIIEDREQNW